MSCAGPTCRGSRQACSPVARSQGRHLLDERVYLSAGPLLGHREQDEPRANACEDPVGHSESTSAARHALQDSHARGAVTACRLRLRRRRARTRSRTAARPTGRAELARSKQRCPAGSAPWRCTREAIPESPSDPTAERYTAAASALRAWLLQMLLVAFSRRMCCSRVESVSTNAILPSASTVRPTTRPGIWRTCSCRQVKKPKPGPPYDIGTAQRLALPHDDVRT